MNVFVSRAATSVALVLALSTTAFAHSALEAGTFDAPLFQDHANGEEAWTDTMSGNAQPAPTLHLVASDDAEHDMSAPATITLGDLELEAGFARATLPNAPVAGGFVSITNHGDEDDTLIAAASDVAGEMQLHNMRVVDDVMQMYEMEGGIAIPAGETVTLAPGGLHIMFMQLHEQLVEGETVDVTLTFEKAGSVDLTLDIRSVGAMGTEMDHGAMSNG